jgi:hypothetical protein
LSALVAGSVVREVGRSHARLDRQARNAQDAALLAARAGQHAPPLGTWAIEPDFGELIMRELVRGPEVVIELGSGVSTLVVGSFLARAERGKLISVEHDEHFLDQTRGLVERAGLAERIEFVHAPLREQQFGGLTVRWYDAQALERAIGGATVDLVVVDGPPSVSDHARWPVLAALKHHLTPKATVLLDDGRAKRESSIAQRWAADHPDFELYWHDTVKGSWRLERGAKQEGVAPRALRSAIRILNPHPSGFGRWGVRRA